MNKHLDSLSHSWLGRSMMRELYECIVKRRQRWKKQQCRLTEAATLSVSLAAPWIENVHDETEWQTSTGYTSANTLTSPAHLSGLQHVSCRMKHLDAFKHRAQQSMPHLSS